MPHHPRALWGFLGALTLLFSTGVSAKGQLSPAGAANHYESAADRVVAEVVQGAAHICTPPTADACGSAVYANTTCGRLEVDRIWRGYSSSCAATCPSPTLALCADDAYHRSLCGALDAYRRSLAGAHPAVEGESCSLAPGTCADVLCQWATGEQATTGSLVADAPVGSVVRAASIHPNTGNATRDRLALEANGFANPDDIVETPLLESDYASFRPRGVGAHYWSRMLFDQALFLAPAGISNPDLNGARLAWVDERERWEANGTTFESCREYVYEKYYDYSLFEDATRRPGIDFREVFDIAFAGAIGGEHPRSAIGTRALSGLPLRMKDGTPLDVEIDFATGVPQNRFFSFEMIEPSARADAIARWEANGRRYTVSVAGEEVTFTTTRPLFQAGNGLDVSVIGFPFAPGPGEEDLYARLRQRRLHNESFAWHKAASDHLSGTPDEVLYLYDRLKDEFATLLERRRALEAEIAALGRVVGDQGRGLVLVDQRPFDPREVINPFESIYTPADQVIFNQRTVVHDEHALAGQTVAPERLLGSSATLSGQNLLGQGAAGAQTRSAPTSGSITMKNPSMGGSVGFLRSVAGSQDRGIGFAGGGVGSGLTKKDTVASRVAGLIRELVAIDEEIEVALRYARSVGCLDPVSPTAPIGAVNACDWSPRDFAEAVEDQLLWKREHDHKRCIELTGDDFDSLRIGEVVAKRFSAEIDPATDAAAFPFYPFGPQGILCDDGPYNESIEWFERYRGCIDSWRLLLQRNIARYFNFLQELLDGANDLIDPITGDVRPNQETSDSGGFGDDNFGAGYDYSAGWSMTLPPESDPTNQLFCNTAPNVWAHFDAAARIFGAEADIVAAGLEAGLGAGAINRASLEILGASLIDVERTATVDAARYNVIFEDSAGQYDEYFHASATFMVGPVPVTVTAGAGGLIAAAVSARGGDSPTGDGCQNGDLALEGTFMPTYSLIGFASAGVDALIVEAGVKIELVIVSLGFPYTMTLELDGRVTNGQPDAMVTLTNDLDLRLSLLGGRVAAFVEVCFILCEEWDFTIFQWAPTVLSKNLFHSTIDFSMKGIFRAREKLPVPTFPGAQP